MAHESPKLNLTRLRVARNGKDLGALPREAAAVYRTRIPGGGLVFTVRMFGLSGVAFYPDPRHEWGGGTGIDLRPRGEAQGPVKRQVKGRICSRYSTWAD